MKHKSRRFLSLLLALAMCLGLMSPYAWAAEVEEVEPEESVTEVETEEPAEIEASSDAEDTVEAETSVENGDVAEPEASSENEDVTEAETPADEEQSTESDTPAVEEETTEAEEPTEAEVPTDFDDAGTELTEETVEEAVTEEAMLAASNLEICGVDIGIAPGTHMQFTDANGNNSESGYYYKSKYLAASQCFGFARWCQYKLFGSHSGTSSGNFKKISVDGVSDIPRGELTVAKLKPLIQAAKPGAHLRTHPAAGATYGHSMIITAITDKGFSIAQCNGSNNNEYTGYKQNYVGTYTYTWAGYVSSTYGQRGIDYIEMPKDYPFSDAKPAAPEVKSWSSAWENDLINLTINWYEVSGATSYEIEWRRADGEYKDNNPITVSGGKTTYTMKNLDPNYNYYFRVYARNAAGRSSKSDTINCCRRPTISSGAANSTSSITINWGGVGNADTYTVRRKLTTESDYTEIQSGISGTSYEDKTVKAGTKYQYQVRAVNSKGMSRYSANYGVTALCATPEMTHWAADSPYSVTIGWNYVANAQSYEIHRNTYVNGPYDYYSTVSAATSSFTDTGVAPGNEYGYRVYAINADGVKSAKPSSYYKVVVPYPETAKHAIDLNRLLDGAEHWELAECATADVWVNGVLVADDQSDYWGEWPEGYTYEVTDVKTKTGYRFDGIQSGSMSGVVGSGDVDLRLMFSTVYHQLDLNGTRDGNYIYSLEDCATVDVYIDGNLVKDDAIDFCDNIKEGSHYEFRDLKVKPGYKFEGIVEGAESGDFFGGTVVNFAFSTIYEASPGTQVLPDGWYMIVSGNDDDRVLDVLGFSGDNGGNLGLWNRYNNLNQRFYLQYLGNGFYSIRAGHSGKFIQKADTSANVFDCNVHQWDGCDSYGAQWKIVPDQDGYFVLEARSGGCLDNVDGSTEEGNNVRAFHFNGSNAQRWKFVSTSDRDGGERLISDGWYTVESFADNNLVLDVGNFSMENGGTIVLWNKDYSSKQIFYLNYSRTPLNSPKPRMVAGLSAKTDFT